MWNDLLQNSANQVSSQISGEENLSEKKKGAKRISLLQAALNSGDIDLAMLLIAGLESQQTNTIAGKLMTSIQEKQKERQAIADQMTSEKDPAKASALNEKAANIGTDIGLLQILLQDIMSQKNEAQQMASNYLKSKHDTAQAIIRNMG